MSVIQGKAKKFSTTKAGVGQSATRPPSFEQVVTRGHIEPEAYQGLQTGPEMALEFEQNQAVPIEGGDRLLRSLSPFVFQVEPPLIYGSDPSLFDGSSKRGLVEVYSKGRLNGFSSARETLSRAGFVGMDYQGSRTEQTVSQGRRDEGLNKQGQPAIADLYVAVDIATQLAAILNTPPLVLLVNPQSISIAHNKIQAFQDRTRYGFVFQAWGDEQPKLSISAKCGAFISGGRGVQFASKRDSAAWQNLMTAFQFYQNNGYIYDTVGRSNAHHLVGALSIHYDGWIYYGHIDSFSYTYDESNQHGGIEFSMEFTASVMVDTSKTTQTVQPMKSPMPNPNDPRYYTRGRGGREGQLSIGLGGNVEDRLFTPGKAPAPWRPADVALGDSRAAPVKGAKTVAKGFGGFTKPQAAQTVDVELSVDPAPFKR